MTLYFAFSGVCTRYGIVCQGLGKIGVESRNITSEGQKKKTAMGHFVSHDGIIWSAIFGFNNHGGAYVSTRPLIPSEDVPLTCLFSFSSGIPQRVSAFFLICFLSMFYFSVFMHLVWARTDIRFSDICSFVKSCFTRGRLRPNPISFFPV